MQTLDLKYLNILKEFVRRNRKNGVIGFSPSPEEGVIRIFVKHEKAIEKVSIPHIEGYGFEIVISGEFKALNQMDGEGLNGDDEKEETDRTDFFDPLVAGISIGHYRITAGCIPPGYGVLANPTFKDISEIREGDMVLTLNGWEKVIWHGSRICYEGVLIEIDPWYLPPVRFTPEHPILVSEKVYKGRWLVGYTDTKWVEAKNVTKQHYLVVPKLPLGNVEINEDFAEFLGIYVAEGSTNFYSNEHGTNYRVRIAVKEGKIADHIERLLNRLFSKVIVSHTNSAMREFTIYSKKLYSFLRRECGENARTKRVPKCILNGTRKVIERFLNGLVLGDGWIETRGRRETYWVHTTSRRLAWDVWILWNKLGYLASIREREVKERIYEGRVLPRTICYDISVNKNSKNYYKLVGDKYLVPIRNIRTVPYSGVVYNFSTPSQHYCVPFVVHNTLGWFGIKNGNIVFITNNHVIGWENKGKKGDPILQPGRYDIEQHGWNPNDPKFIAGKLLGYVPISFESYKCPYRNTVYSMGKLLHLAKPKSNYVDLAWGLAERKVNLEILGLGTVNGWTFPKEGMKVVKSGRTTGVTRGVIDQTQYYGYVTYSRGIAWFEKQILIKSQGTPFSRGGDSGSIVLDEDGFFIGILFAGNEQYTVVNPAFYVLQYLSENGIKMVGVER